MRVSWRTVEKPASNADAPSRQRGGDTEAETPEEKSYVVAILPLTCPPMYFAIKDTTQVGRAGDLRRSKYGRTQRIMDAHTNQSA